MKTKQIVFTKPYAAELLEAECLPPKEHEVSVCLEFSAISSGTEKANLIGQRNGTNVSEDAEATFPRYVGYSAAGTVTEVGAGVKDVRAAGAYPIIAADPIAERREFALKMGADAVLDPTDGNFAKNVLAASEGGVNVCIEVTGLGIGLVQALDCMKRFGRVALLGCTRSSKFEVDYYAKVHGPGISLIGAHTIARPKTESSPGLWTDRDDLETVMNLIRGKRLNFKDMIFEIHSPTEAGRVYERLANDKNFPIGVLFDWRNIE